MLHALARAGELRVTDLAAEVGMTPQAVSNQLQRLVDRRVLAARRDGLSVRYRIGGVALGATHPLYDGSLVGQSATLGGSNNPLDGR